MQSNMHDSTTPWEEYIKKHFLIYTPANHGQSAILFKISCKPKNILENFLAKSIWTKIKQYKSTTKMEVLHQRTSILI